jgi:hypothetical protein
MVDKLGMSDAYLAVRSGWRKRGESVIAETTVCLYGNQKQVNTKEKGRRGIP